MKMVKKSSAGERINHWVMTISFLVLALTGFGFLFDSLNWLNTIFGGGQIASEIHKWLGVVFTISLLFTIGPYLSESMSFSAEDAEWLKLSGGYLSDVEVPAQGRLNAGQKLFYLSVLVLGIAIAVSGFLIWIKADSRSSVMGGHLIHNMAFVLYVTIVPLHIYMATAANPGVFRVMTRGTVPLEWAKKHHGRWVREQGME